MLRAQASQISYLCNVDNLEVPANHERYRSEDAQRDVYHGVDCGLVERWPAARLPLPVLTGQGADPEQGRQGGGQTETPEEEDEQTNPLAGQNRSVPKRKD